MGEQRTAHILLLILCLVISTLPLVRAEDSWVAKKSMQVARDRLGVAVVNGKIYAIGGDSVNLIGTCIGPSFGTALSTTEEYNPATDTWTFKSPMPSPRCSFGVAVYQNKIYCIGGWASYHNYTGVNEVYDPSTDTWETKTAMPTPRIDLQANVVDGNIYLIGGRTESSSYLKVNEVYDPATDTWTTKSASPNPPTSGASAVADDKIYFLARASNLDLGAFVQIYNPEDDSWSTGANSPTYGGWSATAAVASGEGAQQQIVFFSEFSTYVYYPLTDSWALGTTMPTARGFTGVAVVNDTFYVIGGIKAPFEGYIVITSSVATNEHYTPNGYDPVNPDTKVYIRADGSVEPSTANLTTTDNIHYFFTGDNCERIVIERDNIVLDGNGYTLQGTTSYGIALFQRHNVTITNLKITQFQSAGIGLDSSNNNLIVGNDIVAIINDGIRAYSSSNNVIISNNLRESKYLSGIRLEDKSNSNRIFGNNITNNAAGVVIVDSEGNYICHNNFEDDFNPRLAWAGNESNVWDNGYPYGGNYWIDYNCVDADGDGIGDTPYIIDEHNRDNYPLISPIKTFDAGIWEWTQYDVDVISNSTVSDFSFNPEGTLIRFNVEDENGTTGFCRVTIPKDLLHTEDAWTVLVDGNSLTPLVNEDATDTFLYFTYPHNIKTVEIIGTTAIPEFPSWIIIPLLVTATFAVIIYRNRLRKKLR